MRFVVLGIGAVGGTIAASLGTADHEVLALARGEHAARVRAEGLRLATPDGVVSTYPDVVERPGDLKLRPGDVLILATKSQHSAEVLEALPVSARDLPLLCAQNGVSNEREALRRFCDVHGVCVMLPALHTEPGRVTAFGRPSAVFDIGCYPHGQNDLDGMIAAQFSDAGLLTRARDDVMAYKNRKLLTNLGNAVQALVGTDLDTEAEEVARALHRRAIDEGERVLATAGVPVLDLAQWQSEVGAQIEITDVPGVQRGGGSTWQSLVRGAGSVEADHLNGEIVLLARLHGDRAPVNEALRRAVADAAQAGQGPGSMTATELLRTVDAAVALA